MPAKRQRVVKSPNEAAIGVATLSGLISHFLDKITTATITQPEMKTMKNVKLKIEYFFQRYNHNY